MGHETRGFVFVLHTVDVAYEYITGCDKTYKVPSGFRIFKKNVFEKRGRRKKS